MAASPRERFRENASEISGTVVTGIWLVALLTGQEWWLAAMLIGYLVVLPVVSYLYGDGETDTDGWADWGLGWGSDGTERTDETTESDAGAERTGRTEKADALETLKERYARGELTDEQFERKLDRLLDAETLEDVEDRRRGRERERERERS